MLGPGCMPDWAMSLTLPECWPILRHFQCHSRTYLREASKARTMNVDPNQAKAIFLEAVEKHDPDGWPAFLAQACADQPDLRRRVEVLLGAHREAGTAQHQAPAEVPVPVDVSSSAEGQGTDIGRCT